MNKMLENINFTAEDLAVLHLIVIPILLAVCTFFIEKHATIILPAAYVVVLSLLHYARMTQTTNKNELHKSEVFFTGLGYMMILLISLIVVLTILIAF